MKLAIIPARGGSRRIPRKNIRNFAGSPVIHWPIAAALATGLFDHVVVSTDDEEIATVARQAGALTPFVRPSELADDFKWSTMRSMPVNLYGDPMSMFAASTPRHL